MLLIPIIVFLPLAFIIPLALLSYRHAFKITIIAAALTLVLVSAAMLIAHASSFNYLYTSFAYLQSIGVGFSFGITAFTQVLAIMTGIVFLAAAITGRSFIKESQKLYSALFLIILSSALGVFLSGNFFLLYVFWEIGEVAAFFVIYVFGGYNRRYAAIKFLIFSLASSMLLLIGIMLLYANLPTQTFSISYALSSASSIKASVQIAIFVLLLLSFMIKMPIFPLHTWLPDAYAEAPATGSMVIAGVLSKFGGYGMLLAFLMLPVAAHYSFYLAVLFAFSAVYAGFVAIRQVNLKKAIAYSSIVDMGIVALGISTASQLGYAGALYAMLSHGLVIALMFLVAGVVDESFGTLLITKLKGIAKSMESVAYAFMFGTFAIIGLPLTSGFIGDILIFSGLAKSVGPVFLIPLLGILLIGIYFFWLAERVFFNTSKAIEQYAPSPRSFAYASALLIAATIFFGVLPSLLLSTIGTAIV
ncbi:MAG: NADH-quinone oxidoreductase subunit M [Candidatus Micrarchaeaceae archaeon]